jgi:hypothetical protein
MCYKSKEGKQLENDLREASGSAMSKIVYENPSLRFKWSKRIDQSEIAEHLKSQNLDPYVGTAYSGEYISPDGGIFYWIDDKDERHPLLISEVKHQKADGSASARVGVQLLDAAHIFFGESILVYIVFMNGSLATGKPSYARALHTATAKSGFNKTFIENIPNAFFPRASVYTEWEGVPGMRKILYDAACRALQYYLKKYKSSITDQEK